MGAFASFFKNLIKVKHHFSKRTHFPLGEKAFLSFPYQKLFASS